MAETGIVKWLTHDKGHGYIARDEGGMDVYFYYDSVGGGGFDSLTEGDRVDFEAAEGPQGWHATAVIRSGEGPLSARAAVRPSQPDPPQRRRRPGDQ